MEPQYQYWVFLCVVINSAFAVSVQKREDETLGDLFQDIMNSLSGDYNTTQYTDTTTAMTTVKREEEVTSVMTSENTPETITTPKNETVTGQQPGTGTPTTAVLNENSQKDANFDLQSQNVGRSYSSTPSSTRKQGTTENAKNLTSSFGFTSTASSTLNPACDTDRLLHSLCNVSDVPDLLNGINIWDVYFTMFSDTIVEALLLNCASGSWCLKNEYDSYQATMLEKAEMVRDSDAFEIMCKDSARQCIREAVASFNSCNVGKVTYVTEYERKSRLYLKKLRKKKQEVLRATYYAHEYNAPPIWRIDQGGHSWFPIGPKNTNLEEDVEISLPV